MNEATYRLRAFDPSDYPEEARIWTLLDPGVVYSVEELRHQDATFSVPPLVHRKVVAEERSRQKPVGFAYLLSDPESFDPQTFWVDVGVDPEHQGRGLGRALAAAMTLEAEQRSARRLWAGARVDQPRGVRFLTLQGYSERRRSWRSRLDLATAADLPDRTEELARQGISFTTLAHEDLADPRVVRDLYELAVAASADEPRLGPYTPITLEQFVEMDLRSPTFLPDAYFLARKDGRFVAMCALRRAAGESTTLHQSFTGTRRELRGRGIATELKRRAVEYAREHGIQSIRTGNDSLNQPMLAINRKLGFRFEREQIFAERELRRGTPTGRSGTELRPTPLRDRHDGEAQSSS